MRKNLLLLLIFLSFLCIGLPNSLLGAAWPTMAEEIGSPLSFAGVISFSMAAGMVLSSLCSERVIRSFGHFPTVAAAILLLALSLSSFAFFQSPGLLVLSGLSLGIGLGMNESALNGYMVNHYGSAHMNLAHCLWSIGGGLGPVLMASFLRRSEGWRAGYITSGGVEVLILFIILCGYPLWRGRMPKKAAGDGDGDGKPASLNPVRRNPSLPGLPGVPQAILSFFLYCSLENTVIIWGASYLVLIKDMGEADAAGKMSLYFIGMTAGRMLAGLVALRIRNRDLVRGGFCAVAVAIPLLVFSESGLFLSIACGLLGIGCAPVFPCLMHETGENYEAAYTQAIVGMQQASAFTGNAGMPLAFGFLAEKVGYSMFPLLLFLTLILLTAATEWMNRVAGAGGPSSGE